MKADDPGVYVWRSSSTKALAPSTWSRRFRVILTESSSIAFRHTGFVYNLRLALAETCYAQPLREITKMAPSNKLSFNFSSEPPPNNYIRRPAASARRKQAKVVEAPSVVVDDDWSPLFVPHSDGTPDQTEVSQHP